MNNYNNQPSTKLQKPYEQLPKQSKQLQKPYEQLPKQSKQWHKPG